MNTLIRTESQKLRPCWGQSCPRELKARRELRPADSGRGNAVRPTESQGLGLETSHLSQALIHLKKYIKIECLLIWLHILGTRTVLDWKSGERVFPLRQSLYLQLSFSLLIKSCLYCFLQHWSCQKCFTFVTLGLVIVILTWWKAVQKAALKQLSRLSQSPVLDYSLPAPAAAAPRLGWAPQATCVSR